MSNEKSRRYGTPYDPKYMGGGKIERPKEEKHLQLGGCGDPNCASCNPESANAGKNTGGTVTGRFSSRNPNMQYLTPSFSLDSDDTRARVQEMQRRLAEAFARRFNGGPMLYFDVEGSDGPGTPGSADPAKKMPPMSYTEARDAVKDYVLKAPDQSFDDIVGNDDVLEALRDAIKAPVEQKELYEAYGMKMPKGALLSGPPGCGKTMFARAAASEMKRLYGGEVEFVAVSGGELQSMYVGETEGRIKAIFKFAREYKAFHGHPLLVFIDEADVLFPDRTGRVRRVAPWEESQVATFLAEMDGVQESGAFVMLATNRPEVIDQAVLRDGRCDFKIVIKRPSFAALESILRKNFEKAPKLKDPLDDLVFAALESFSDPHKVIVAAHLITLQNGKLSDAGGKNFTLEHIVSGAMAAGIPARATRYAFKRDKASGEVSGLTVSDVLAAVNALFEENKDLEHDFALNEFKSEFEQEMRTAGKLK